MIAHDLFIIGVPIAEKAIRTIAVYLGLLVLLRLAGKRDLAELNTFDLVVLLLLSNVVQNAVIGNDNSLAGGLLGAAVLIAANSLLVRFARRSEITVKLLEGDKTILIRDGSVLEDELRHLGIRRADLEVAVLRQGANSVGDVALATLEPGGTIVVQLRDDAMAATRGDIERLEAKLDRLLSASGG